MTRTNRNPASRVAAFGLAVAISLVAATGAAAGDFRAGRSAYNMSQFKKAFEIWQPLAEQGDAKSQSSIAYLYLRGLGVERDNASAAEWYGKAAAQGRPEAMYFLGTLYLMGHGVPRDYVRAYVSCDNAVAHGIAEGLHCRAAASRAMDEKQTEEAYHLASEVQEDDSGK